MTEEQELDLTAKLDAAIKKCIDGVFEGVFYCLRTPGITPGIPVPFEYGRIAEDTPTLTDIRGSAYSTTQAQVPEKRWLTLRERLNLDLFEIIDSEPGDSASFRKIDWQKWNRYYADRRAEWIKAAQRKSGIFD